MFVVNNCEELVNLAVLYLKGIRKRTDKFLVPA